MNRTLLLTVLAGVFLVTSVSVLYLSARSVIGELPRLPFVAPLPQPEVGLPEMGDEVKFETLGKARISEHQEEESYVIKNDEEWKKLWDKITGLSARAMLPAVDFEKEAVVAVFQGRKSSAGYSIEVTKILDVDGKLEVSVTKTSPGAGCITTQVITAPYHLVKVQEFIGEVRFVVENKEVNCR